MLQDHQVQRGMAKIDRQFLHNAGLRLSFVVLLWFLAGCDQAVAPDLGTSLLGQRAATDPLTAVEGYLQQYQPGAIPRVFQSTKIFDRHGVLIAELFEEGRRTWITHARVSPHLINATVATEDDSFYSNSGVDPLRIVSAALRNFQAGQVVSGASTITMQLARNLFLGADQRYDQSVDRKLLEAGLAQELTALYSKDELLEMYLNLLNYGNLVYGPEAAAQFYFGKPAAGLTLAEATMLAGIPQQPAVLDPYTNFEGVRARQRIVLDLMVRHGYLSAMEADLVFAQPLALQPRPGVPLNRAPHFVQYIVESLDRQFGAGYTRRAGFNITTTLDLSMQQLAQQIVAQKVDELRLQYDLSNAALVALKPPRAEILVMVGSADFDDPTIAGQVNVAVRMRQPGSAIKPVLYATALNDNLVSPATVLWDVPVTYTVAPGQIYAPRNYDNTFHGPVTVRSALANSYNVPTVKLLNALGVSRMLESARRMGVQSLNQPSEFYGLSLTLGGGDVTLLDLTTAYHTLANEGRFVPPQAILAVTDSRGNTGELNTPPTPQPVLAPDAAFLVTDILSDNEARLPMFGANGLLQLSRPAAVKTGTTTDFRDNWTIGYTRYLVAGVWTGNSDGRPMRNTSGVTGAAPIWHDFMQAILEDPAHLATLGAPDDPEAWRFIAPADVEQRRECPPGVTCRGDGELFTKAWLEAAGEHGPLADSIERVAAAPVYIDAGDGGRRAGFCTLEGAAERTLLRQPAGFGLPLDEAADGQVNEHRENSADLFSAQAFAPQAIAASPSQEQLQVMVWSLRYGLPVNLGRCDKLQDLAPRALALDPQLRNAGPRILVDLAAANSADVGDMAGSGAIEIAAINRAVDIINGVAGGPYRLTPPIIHDNNCPGQYIMGRVLNREGTPVPNVHIRFRDQWGNESAAVSKSGASDFGMFDFPIPSGSPHEIYLWVVDEAGNPISSTITIQHRQGEAGEAPCHHVVIQGG